MFKVHGVTSEVAKAKATKQLFEAAKRSPKHQDLPPLCTTGR